MGLGSEIEYGSGGMKCKKESVSSLFGLSRAY